MKSGQSYRTLLHKEIQLEWRSKYALSGVLLYVAGTVFIVYAAFEELRAPVWNALFWIVVFFSGINAVTRGFVQESGAQRLYYYYLAPPLSLFLAKVTYHICLLLVLNFLIWAGFTFVAESPIRDTGLFVLTLTLAAVGLAIIFTFISAIAAKAPKSGALMTILSLPLVLPVILSLVKLSSVALGLQFDTAYSTYIVILLAFDLILMAAAILLYPYLWRD